MIEQEPGLNGDTSHELTAALEQNLDSLIDEWGSDLRDEWNQKGRPTALGDPDDYKGMHRTALITICRLRQTQAATTAAHEVNAQFGNYCYE